MLAGEPVMIVDGFRYLEADGRLLMRLSTLLLVLVNRAFVSAACAG